MRDKEQKYKYLFKINEDETTGRPSISIKDDIVKLTKNERIDAIKYMRKLMQETMKKYNN
jgi:hypothetical protein